VRRLRNLQVGSPVPLTLAAQYPMRDRATAEAVAVALRERFRARRERGDWFRAARAEVARVLGECGLRELSAPAAAGEWAACRCRLCGLERWAGGGPVSRFRVSGGVRAQACVDRDPRSRLGQGVDDSDSRVEGAARSG
jgi:hypothetical protein